MRTISFISSGPRATGTTATPRWLKVFNCHALANGSGTQPEQMPRSRGVPDIETEPEHGWNSGKADGARPSSHCSGVALVLPESHKTNCPRNRGED